MKKRRLLSWLLTAALAISCLPAVGLSAAQVDDGYLTIPKRTASSQRNVFAFYAPVDSASDLNGYTLRMEISLNGTNGTLYTNGEGDSYFTLRVHGVTMENSTSSANANYATFDDTTANDYHITEEKQVVEFKITTAADVTDSTKGSPIVFRRSGTKTVNTDEVAALNIYSVEIFKGTDYLVDEDFDDALTVDGSDPYYDLKKTVGGVVETMPIAAWDVTPTHTAKTQPSNPGPNNPEEDDAKGVPGSAFVLMLLLKKKGGESGSASAPKYSLSANGKALDVKSYSGKTANKYLQVYNTLANTNGVTLKYSNLAAGSYTFEFDMRPSVTLKCVDAIDFADDSTNDVIRVREEYGSKNTTFFDFKAGGSWKHVSVPVTSDGSEKDHAISIYGGAKQTYSMPFEIDNIVIKDSKGNPVYTQNFDALNTESYVGSFSIPGAGAGATFTLSQRNAGISDYAIVNDDSYVSATTTDNAVVTYNLGDTVLAAGTYVFKGSIRNGYFDGTNKGKSFETLEEAQASDYYLNWLASDVELNGKTIKSQSIVVNNNKMAVKVSAAVGETVTAADYTVESNWTDFAVKFTVADGQTPVLTFTLDHAKPYTIDGKSDRVPFDLKNVEIVPAY